MLWKKRARGTVREGGGGRELVGVERQGTAGGVERDSRWKGSGRTVEM